MPPMYALVFALALVLAGCSKDTPTAPAPKVNPSSDGITSPPGLFPDPSDLPVKGLNTLEQPDQYDLAADVLWGSILGNEQQEAALVRALDGMRVLVSGVIPIDGKEQLYLGIDEATFAKHDIENLRKVLEARFPDIPVFIEESEGVILHSDTEEDTPVDIFSDDFSNLTAWTANSAWSTGVFTHPVPDEDTGNRVASIRSTDCTGTCTLTTKPMDLSGYSSVTLSLHRWLDDAMDAGDTFVVEVGNDGVYRTVGSWDSDDGDDVWHYNTFTLDRQQLGEQTTVRITVTMSSLSGLFSLFSGSEDETEERVMAVDNVRVQGTEAANLVVRDVSVSPKSADSGASVQVRYSVKNAGTASASQGNVSVYRHFSKTDTPATGGERVSTFAMQSSLAPGAGFDRAANIRTPSVSEDTVVYYYVCVDAADGEEQTDDNCGDPVTVTVKAEVTTPDPETPVETPVETPADDNEQVVVNTPANDYTEPSYPKPPYESCYHAPERKHVMAGDSMLPQPLKGKILDRTGVYACGTITLGGVETKDGTKGFVVSGHVITGGEFDINSLTNTDVLTGHGTYMKNFDMGRLLGKVYKTSAIRNEGDEKVLVADAAFVAYPQPKTSGCSLTWSGRGETFCLDLGDNQIERTAPLKIRGKGKEVYTVVGSQKPSKGLALQITGAVSGVIETDPVTTDRKVLTDIYNDLLYAYTHSAPTKQLQFTTFGDSGSPVYTTPDSDGNVRIVGVYKGDISIDDTVEHIFNSWHDVTDALDLEPID